MISNWKKLIEDCMQEVGDSTDNIVAMTLTEEEANRKFDCGFGCSEGEPFTLWTKYNVYFPVTYDGSEWVGSAPRNPNGKKTDHQGGG